LDVLRQSVFIRKQTVSTCRGFVGWSFAVKCRLCSTELSYINKSTSSMLRHYRARHGNEELADTRERTPVPNKQAVDEAVVNMIIKDCQPLSFVENEGFREPLKLIIPSNALPSRKACLRNVIFLY
ncbi:hypothetical protein D4764_15G0013440, partial [Takifugu flavidus]